MTIYAKDISKLSQEECLSLLTECEKVMSSFMKVTVFGEVINQYQFGFRTKYNVNDIFSFSQENLRKLFLIQTPNNVPILVL